MSFFMIVKQGYQSKNVLSPSSKVFLKFNYFTGSFRIFRVFLFTSAGQFLKMLSKNKKYIVEEREQATR